MGLFRHNRISQVPQRGTVPASKRTRLADRGDVSLLAEIARRGSFELAPISVLGAVNKQIDMFA